MPVTGKTLQHNPSRAMINYAQLSISTYWGRCVVHALLLHQDVLP